MVKSNQLTVFATSATHQSYEKQNHKLKNHLATAINIFSIEVLQELVLEFLTPE